MKANKTNETVAALAPAMRADGWKIATYKALPLVIAWRVYEGGRVSLKAWRGNAEKPTFFYAFRNEEKARRYMAEYERKVRESEAWKAARNAERAEKRAKLKACDHYVVGDVVYDSWGYDQTNVDYYQVVEVKAKSVVIREVKQNSSDAHGGPCGGYTQPRRGEFCGEPILKPLDEDGRIASKHGCFSKWDGRPKYTSSYH